MWITSVLRWIEHCQLKTIIFRATRLYRMKEQKRSSGLNKQLSTSILTPSNWQIKFTNNKGPFVILRTFIILLMVGSSPGYGCTNRKQKGGHFIFQFSTLQSWTSVKWVQAMQRKDWFPSKHSLICSIHFTKSFFVVRPGKRGRLLKEGWVPTEFSAFLIHLQKCTTTEIFQEKAAKRNFEANVTIQNMDQLVNMDIV